MGGEEDGAQRAGIVGSALRGASLLASVQLLSRALTFVLNVGLTRHLEDPSLLGVSSVQLYLLYTVVLTLAREGVRRTCLRTAAARGDGPVAAHGQGAAALATRRDLVNLTWCAVLAGWAATPLACQWFIWSADAAALEKISMQDYRQSIWIVGLAIVTELLSEPMFVAAQGQLAYGRRSAIEALAVTARCLVTIGLVLAAKMGLQAFAFGYVAYAATLLLGYTAYFAQASRTTGQNQELSPIWALHGLEDLKPTDWLRVRDADLFQLAASMSLQQVWKLVLAEGEKMVMVTLATDASDQAVYALVFNLGSLVARFVFLPIEEAAFAVFGKLNDLAKHGNTFADAPQSTTARISPRVLVALLCRAMTLLGLVFVAFGPSYAHFLIHFLYGERWSEHTTAPQVLGYYCVYVLVLAVNGVTEAYVHATANDATLRRFNGWLFVFSVVYLASAAALVQYRAPGLILANSINMAMRIVFSVRYIVATSGSSVTELFPAATSLAAFALAAIATHLSAGNLYANFASWSRAAAHIGVGASALISLVAFLGLFAERPFVREVQAVRAEMSSSTKSKGL
ncbi:Protein RFT1-like [Hondaea fermentalgiana]|uniref:Protein RFT1 homolog n=1 Tax=Hondaea fermentalgiana TaxID=2315210 RepID=A0A2R5G3V3_9STRA|nr:Protein RFT1-like [Hondaea fermentalgiana]|eukprot:GBG25680.1 Protein RFT1-like [Hondaea fermentalgiana]